jgi:sigma-B regulation protein RsbU (phosphoserine phosphatase)
MLPGVDFGNPAEVLEALNVYYPMDHNQVRFITLWYGVYDSETRSLEYASAGHPPALVWSLSEQIERLDHSSIAIGIEPDAGYDSEKVTVPAAGQLWLYSDGTYEARSTDGDVLGIAGLASLVARAAHTNTPTEQVVQEIREFQKWDHFQDDLALLAITFK